MRGELQPVICTCHPKLYDALIMPRIYPLIMPLLCPDYALMLLLHAGDVRSEEGKQLVDQYHQLYMQKLRELFDAHKDKYAANRLADLRFVA